MPVGQALAQAIVQGDDEPEQKRYDRFRDRIMFPIINPRGAVIGFGGRVLDQGEPKYLNSPETPLFEKGQELYGLYQARKAIREAERVLVVEGYMDVVALAQHGVEFAVAALGTATTPIHARTLLRHTDRLVYAFDGCGSDDWLRFQPGLPGGSTLHSVDAGMGLWIHATEAATLTQSGPALESVGISLCAGWNLATYPSAAAKPLPDALSSIAGKYGLVYAYDGTSAPPEWAFYDPIIPYWGNALFNLSWGAGYWIRATEDCTLTVEN